MFFFFPGEPACLQLYLILLVLNKLSSIAIFSCLLQTFRKKAWNSGSATKQTLSGFIKLKGKKKKANRSPSDWDFIIEQDRV